VGPYAESLAHVLREVEGCFVSGYRDGGDAPDKQLELMPGAIRDAKEFLGAHPVVQARLDRVAELVEGFETPFGLELLSTVHWVIGNEHPRTMDDLVTRIYAWNSRKEQFSPRQIKLAVDVLTKRGWVDPGVMAEH